MKSSLSICLLLLLSILLCFPTSQLCGYDAIHFKINWWNLLHEKNSNEISQEDKYDKDSKRQMLKCTLTMWCCIKPHLWWLVSLPKQKGASSHQGELYSSTSKRLMLKTFWRKWQLTRLGMLPSPLKQFRIDKIAEDAERQLFERFSESQWHAIQVDESTDAGNQAIFLVCMWCFYQDDLQGGLLSDLLLPTKTTWQETFRGFW